jgi:hypothetical protein
MQLVEKLRYKPEGSGFDSWRCLWNFSLTWSFRPHYGPGINSASKRNEYHEYLLRDKGGRYVGLTTLPPSCADRLEILGASTSWKPQDLSRPMHGKLHQDGGGGEGFHVCCCDSTCRYPKGPKHVAVDKWKHSVIRVVFAQTVNRGTKKHNRTTVTQTVTCDDWWPEHLPMICYCFMFVPIPIALWSKVFKVCNVWDCLRYRSCGGRSVPCCSVKQRPCNEASSHPQGRAKYL